MKALIIILACLLLVVALRVLEVLTSNKAIKSVGGKSNRHSKNMPKVNINDPESVKSALEAYKDLAD